MLHVTTDDVLIGIVSLLFHCYLLLKKKRKKLEDLKVLRRSPDLLNNVKIGQGQLQLIIEQI